MSETTQCPLEGLKEDSDGCDGQANLLFDGSLYCPTCENMFETEYTLRDEDENMYAEEVRDLLEEDAEVVYEEYIRLLDLYYKKPLGFPDEGLYQRFQCIFPLLIVKYIQTMKSYQEEVNREIRNQLRRQSINKKTV